MWSSDNDLRRMESMCLIFFTRTSQGPGFLQLWGVSNSVSANQALGLWRDPFSSLGLCRDSFISLYSGGPHCAPPLCPCISFAWPLFWILLETNRRHWVRAKAGIRTARFTLSWRWANFENVKEGEEIQLYSMHTVGTSQQWCEAGVNSSCLDSWPHCGDLLHALFRLCSSPKSLHFTLQSWKF